MVNAMDGTMDVESQIRLMRTVIGRKYMEMDDFIEKCAVSPGDAEIYEALIELLKNDVRGYKSLIACLEGGTSGEKAEYYDLGSLSEREVGLYNDVYLPLLAENDFADERQAMSFKSKYTCDAEMGKYIRAGRAALDSPLLITLMARNSDIAATIGKLVLSEPELASALEDETVC